MPHARAWRSLAILCILVASVAVAWPSETVSAATPTLTRYPYVSEVVANSARVNWATDRSQTTGTATWGTVTNGVCTPSNPMAASKTAISVGTATEYQWTVVLALPGPGTYCYRIQLAGADLLGTDPSPRVSTAASAGSPFSFAVLGDWGAGTSGEANVLSRVGASPASFVVSTGDNVYNSGTETEYGDLSHGNIFATPYLPALAGKPIFASEGNHGFTTNLPYLQDFSALTAAQASGGRFTQESYCCISTLSGPHAYPSAWYAFNWGSARFYVLDGAWADSQGGYQGDFLAHWNGPVSGCGPCGAELQWLKSDLAANAGTPIKFAFFHYPLHADSAGEGSDPYLGGASGLEGLLATNNVQIAFNGHAHQYERNNPQIAGNPLVSYVTGGGGAPLGSISGCSAFDAYALGSGSSCRAPKPASDANVYHFLLVTVNGNQVTVTPTDSTGRTFDVQTYTYSTGPTVAIDSAPNPLTSSTSATLAFHSTPAGSTLTCSLDGAAGSACTSPVTYSGLAAGAHTFSVTATSGGTVSSPAVAHWTVDTAPPTVPTNLAGKASTSGEIDLTWTASTDDTGVAGYDIVRNGTVIASTSGTGAAYADKTVAPSTTYQYAVDARDGAGNTSSPTTAISVTTPAPSGPILVQTAGSSTSTVTLPAPSTPGDLLVLSASVSTGKSKPITAISDGTNSWTKIGAYAVSGSISDGEMWYAANAASVSSVKVKTTAPGVALRLQEFGGVAATNPLDTPAGTSNTGTSASSGTATSTFTNELAVGFIAGHGNSEPINVTAPGFTTQPQQTTTGSIVTVITGYQVLSSPGAQSFAGTFTTAMYWASGIALFKPES